MKTLTGKVVAATLPQTVTVLVEWLTTHPKYKKQMKRSRKFLCQCDSKVAVGDTVIIKEVRPLSARKHFSVLEKVSEKSVKKAAEAKTETNIAVKAETKAAAKAEKAIQGEK
jgi:small subunit ribosomal protein S17